MNKDNEELELKRNLVEETVLFTRAELTIKDNNDITIANLERHSFRYTEHGVMRSKNSMGMYCYFIHFLFNNFNFKIVHFCYFQNTFPFVSKCRQTDDIGKKHPKIFVEQGIDYICSHIQIHNVKMCSIPNMNFVHDCVHTPGIIFYPWHPQATR